MKRSMPENYCIIKATPCQSFCVDKYGDPKRAYEVFAYFDHGRKLLGYYACEHDRSPEDILRFGTWCYRAVGLDNEGRKVYESATGEVIYA